MARIRRGSVLILCGLGFFGCGSNDSDLFGSQNALGGRSGAANAGTGADDPGGGAGDGAGGVDGPAGGAETGGDDGSETGGASNGGTTSGGTSDGGAVSGGRVGKGGSSAGGASSGGRSVGVGGGNVGGGISVGGKVSTGGAGGTGGAPPTCTDSDNGDLRIQGEVKASIDGSFTDSCEEGNLVEYACQVTFAAGDCLAASRAAAGGNTAELVAPPQCEVPTGKVVQSIVDCGGRCHEGTCFYWCPEAGQELEYLQVQNGVVRFENAAAEVRYECELAVSDDAAGGRSGEGSPVCTNESIEGRAALVTSVAECGPSELAFAATLVDVANAPVCNYECSLLD